MKIIYVDNAKCINTDDKVCAIGFFDAVHKGHQKIFKKLNEISGCKSKAIITFDKAINKNQYVNDLNIRLKLYQQFDIDIVYIIKSDSDFIKQNYKNFIMWLKENHISIIVCGQDLRFGYQAEGQVSDLQMLFDVIVVEAVLGLDNDKISTGQISDLLKAGKVDKANEYLGYNYFIISKVIYGNQLGRTIDFPTANIELPFTVLQNGVYATNVILGKAKYRGITNIGYNPTVSDNLKLKIETYILDFDNDIYGEEIKIEFIYKIRDESKFNSIEELKEQLTKDKKERKTCNL